MPKENKNARGRRDEKRLKRKRENGEEHPNANKRQKSQEPEDVNIQFIGTDNAVSMVEGGEEEGGATERPFYGMLEDQEQEYFRRADELLEQNDFPSDEERSLFLANVYREADGKELKIACSQSCSRLMERLILLSTTEQKKKLFGKFSDNYPHLIQHRFASHCCETLFIQSAPVVTEELTADTKSKKQAVEKDADVNMDTDGTEEEEEELPSMEELFLATLDELEGQMTFLLTDRFASHTLRVLLVILSGRALEKASTRTLMQSKKKEKISITGLDTTPTELSLNKRAVPSSFQYAIDKIISDTIATMDTTFIQILATHPTGNPTLQLLLELELTNPNTKKGLNASEKTIISALLPDEITEEKSESQTFINGILYDAIGSRLLETICTFAPGKLFKQIYRTVFKDRIAAVARNEISSYVAIRVLNRLSKEDLEEAVEAIIPQIEDLVKRNRTVILKTLLERCQARGADTKGLVDAIAASYDPKTSNVLLKMSCIDDIATLLTSTQPSEDSLAAPPPKPSSSQLHGSLLAQAMLTISGPPTQLIQDSLLSLPPQILLALSIYTTTSHTIQAALLPTPCNTIPFRRKLINTLLFPPGEDDNSNSSPTLTLALSNTGSHVLDALLTSTAAPTSLNTSATPLFSITERIATILLGCEPQLRDSWTGRIVLRNWSLDLFKRRRSDWVKKTKEAALNTVRALPSFSLTPSVPESQPIENDEDDGAEAKVQKVSAPGQGKKNRNDRKRAKQAAKEEAKGPQKSAIQLAREKFAKGKLEKNNPSSGGKGKEFRTGANATRPVST